jgi:hypothetical protein
MQSTKLTNVGVLHPGRNLLFLEKDPLDGTFEINLKLELVSQSKSCYNGIVHGFIFLFFTLFFCIFQTLS